MKNLSENKKQTNAFVLYKTIFENTGTGTILIEEDMTIAMVNTELARMAGIDKSGIEGKMKFPELLAEADREKVVANHLQRRTHPDAVPGNYPCRVRDGAGNIRECILTVAMIEGTRQSVASITDITRQKELERQVAGISENERRRMGRVLHDDLGSHLAGVEAMSSLLFNRLAKQENKEAELAGEIRGLVNEAISKIRAMVRGLLSVDLSHTGFVDALEQCAADVQKAFGLTCRVKSKARDYGFSDVQTLTHIYYIIREALNNAARHANADTIDIRLKETQDDFIIDVADNGNGMAAGRGIAEKTAPAKGSGLLIMQHRADLIGAELTIADNPCKGTAVRCRIEKKYLL